MQEREYLDIDTYDHLVFRVKGDGRKYIASLRTDNWIIGGRSHDVWQAFLFARWACCCPRWPKRVLFASSPAERDRAMLNCTVHRSPRPVHPHWPSLPSCTGLQLIPV